MGWDESRGSRERFFNGLGHLSPKQQKLFCLCADVDSDSGKFNVLHMALKDSGVVTLARTSGPI